MTLSHVRAHARTPGNEAADQLAKEVARDGTVSNDAMRALTIASTAHRRVRGESDSPPLLAESGGPMAWLCHLCLPGPLCAGRG